MLEEKEAEVSRPGHEYIFRTLFKSELIGPPSWIFEPKTKESKDYNMRLKRVEKRLTRVVMYKC